MFLKKSVVFESNKFECIVTSWKCYFTVTHIFYSNILEFIMVICDASIIHEHSERKIIVVNCKRCHKKITNFANVKNVSRRLWCASFFTLLLSEINIINLYGEIFCECGNFLGYEQNVYDWMIIKKNVTLEYWLPWKIQCNRKNTDVLWINCEIVNKLLKLMIFFSKTLVHSYQIKSMNMKLQLHFCIQSSSFLVLSSEKSVDKFLFCIQSSTFLVFEFGGQICSLITILKMKAKFTVLILFVLFVHLNAHISIQIDDDGFLQVGDFLQTFVRGPIRPYEHSFFLRNLYKFVRVFVQMLSIMITLVGSNLITTKLTPAITLPQQGTKVEISLGNNVTNFNKQFKNEFGCRNNVCWKSCYTEDEDEIDFWCFTSPTVALREYKSCTYHSDCAPYWECLNSCHNGRNKTYIAINVTF